MAALLKVIYDTFIWVEIVLNVRSLFQRPTFYNGGGKKRWNVEKLSSTSEGNSFLQ